MLGNFTRRLVTVAAACAVAAVVADSAAASPIHTAAVKVGPDPDFAGLVNGKTSHAVIRVLCPGPLATGHPLSGQTVKVALVVDPITANDGSPTVKAATVHLTFVSLGA
jgi:hypothetical protein